MAARLSSGLSSSQPTFLRRPGTRAVRSRKGGRFAWAELDLGGDIAVRLACSWGQPLGRDAVIEATCHGDFGTAQFRNLDGSFFDFIAEHYQQRRRHVLCMPPDAWGGRALLDWIQRLALSNRFAADAEEILRVSRVSYAIYSGPHIRRR